MMQKKELNHFKFEC